MYSLSCKPQADVVRGSRFEVAVIAYGLVKDVIRMIEARRIYIVWPLKGLEVWDFGVNALIRCSVM